MPICLVIVSGVAAIAVSVGFLTLLFALVCGLLKISAFANVAHLMAQLVVFALLLATALAMHGLGA